MENINNWLHGEMKKGFKVKTNLFQEEHSVGSAVADFDNNGFSDPLIIRRGELIHENES